MHPYNPGFHSFHHWHRGPRRFLWFFFGAAAATLWIKHKETRANGYGSWTNHCIRPPIRPLPAVENGGSTSQVTPPFSPHDIPKIINNIPPADPWGAQSNQSQAAWNEEKERMATLSRQATDKMTELSEATLDTVLTTVEVLKAKLAEHRAERDKQLVEEQKRQEHSRRLV